MTAPIFKPFVMVRLPVPTGYVSGEVRGVNNSGQAVGWMMDDEDVEFPFVFDPSIEDPDLRLHFLEPAGDTEGGMALAINDGDPAMIVGYSNDTASTPHQRAAVWTWNGQSSNFEGFIFSSGVVSVAHDVNDDEIIVGVHDNSGSRSFVYDFNGQTFAYPASGSDSEALGINASEKVVGWHDVSGDVHAYSWTSDTTTDINPNGYDYSGTFSVNAAGNIGGWVAESSLSEKVPALWTLLFQGVYTVDPFPVGSSAAVTALNSHGEMAITREGASGAAIWSKRTGVDDADLLDDLTLMPGSSDVLHAAWAINDNGWIGGSYLAGGTGNPQPCLIIPYDVDNNEVPDYREILESKREGFTDLDTNNNWLLDSGELMRVGLHSPGYSGDNWRRIDAQVARLSMHLRNLATDDIDDFESYPLDGVLTGEITCENFQTAINQWARGDQTYERQREIIIWLRSSLNDEDMDSDYLPEAPLQVDRDDILDDVNLFAHRFAKCIDYIQTGNEVFGGAGGYKFYESNLPMCSQSHSWEGAIGFQQLHSDCKAEAAEAVLLWLHDQMWAALEGSALAGRPLRMIGPGIPYGIVNDGYNDAGVSRSLMTTLTPWLNERQMHFDLHLHYEEVENEDPDEPAAITVVRKLTDTLSGSSAPWDVPHRIVSLEMGPRANGSWFSTEQTQFHKFHDDEGCVSSQDPPYELICCWDDPGETWEDFVERWRAAQFSSYDDFGVLDVLDEMAAPGSDSTLEFTAVCYGPTIMHPEASMVYDMACLRATRVCDNTQQITFITTAFKFTELKDHYETALLSHWINGFTAHPSDCDGCP